MAAITACGRQAGSGALSRVAACAWNLVSQPRSCLNPLEDVQLHGSAPGTHRCPERPVNAPLESIHDVYPSKPGFLWMGKGDKRTFRGKLKRGSYGKSRPKKLKDPLTPRAWWHQDTSESSTPQHIPIPHPPKQQPVLEVDSLAAL